MGTDIKHPMPDRVKPASFVIFDIRALWRSALSVRVPGCQKYKLWHSMLYICTHITTVGVKGLRSSVAVALRCQVQGPSSALLVHLETVWIRSASDGDEDRDGSGRDDQEAARGTRSFFWHERTYHVVCGKRYNEHVVWSSIWPRWSGIPTAHSRQARRCCWLLPASRDISRIAFSSAFQKVNGKVAENREAKYQLYQQSHCCLHGGL